MTTKIAINNALGAKVINFIPLNGTEGDIVSNAGVTLNAGSYVNDSEKGMVLEGVAGQLGATLNALNLAGHNQITYGFWAKGIGNQNLLQQTNDWTQNANAIIYATGPTYSIVGANHGRGGYMATTFGRPENDGAWHYYIVTMDDRYLEFPVFATLMIDGVQVERTDGFGISGESFSNYPLEILRDAGRIKDIVFFNGILSAEERAALAADPSQILQPADLVDPTVTAVEFSNTMKNGVSPGLKITYSEPVDVSDITPFLYTLTGHTFSGTFSIPPGQGSMAAGATQIVFAVDGSFTYNETPTLSYVDGSFATKDMSGNPMDPFTGRVVTNSVPAPAADGSTVPNAPSNVVAVKGDGKATLSWNAPSSNGGSPVIDYLITASTGQTAASTTLTGEVTGLSNGGEVYFTVIARNANGPSQASSPSNFVIPNPPGSVDSDIQMGSILVRTRGIGPGKTFANMNAFREWIKNLDLVGTNTKVIGKVFTNDAPKGNFTTMSNDESRFVIIEPADGFGVNDYFSPTVAQNYGTQGVELLCKEDNYDGFGVCNGILVRGFRILIEQGNTGPGGLTLRSANGSRAPSVVGNRIKVNSWGGLGLSAYAWGVITDNFICRDAAVGGTLFRNAWKANFDRNTVVLLPGGSADQAVYNEYGGSYRDNVFSGFAQCFSHGSDVGTNYSNVAGSGTQGNVTIDTVNPFFQGVNDFRPNTGLLGKGTAVSTSTNDALGSNRGVTPDMGAFQLNPAMPLPVGSVTVQEIDGASLIFSGTTTNAPTSGKLTLSPADPANGAQPHGPYDLVLTSGAFALSEEDANDLEPGNYFLTGTLTNAGGTALIQGTSAFEIAGVGKLVYDTGGLGDAVTPIDPPPPVEPPPVVVLPAPTVSITTAADSIMTGKDATINMVVDTKADANATVAVSMINQVSGAILPVGLVTLNGVNGTKTAEVAKGRWKAKVVVTANGKTAEALSGEFKVLGLAGTFVLPAA
jgi:hypothetical protein